MWSLNGPLMQTCSLRTFAQSLQNADRLEAWDASSSSEETGRTETEADDFHRLTETKDGCLHGPDLPKTESLAEDLRRQKSQSEVRA